MAGVRIVKKNLRAIHHQIHASDIGWACKDASEVGGGGVKEKEREKENPGEKCGKEQGGK